MGLAANSLARLCHSCTLCGFWRSMTELSSSGRRSIRCSSRASLAEHRGQEVVQEGFR